MATKKSDLARTLDELQAKLRPAYRDFARTSMASSRSIWASSSLKLRSIVADAQQGHSFRNIIAAFALGLRCLGPNRRMFGGTSEGTKQSPKSGGNGSHEMRCLFSENSKRATL